MKILKSKYIIFFFSLFLIISCNPDDVPIEEPVELITTLTYTLVPVISGGDAVVLSFKDLDGDGGNVPTIIGGTLTANTTYSGTISLLNETTTPAEDIAAEVKSEDVDHQFFFAIDNVNLSLTYSDQDANGQPLGLTTALTTGNASSGTLMLTLRHQPDKNAVGVADGDISNAGGETDIEVAFPIEVQ